MATKDHRNQMHDFLADAEGGLASQVGFKAHQNCFM